MVITDKLGTALNTIAIPADADYLMFEYTAKTRNWILFKHQVSRLYGLPQYKLIENKRRNTYRDYFLTIQSGNERQAKSVVEFAEEITVTV